MTVAKSTNGARATGSQLLNAEKQTTSAPQISRGATSGWLISARYRIVEASFWPALLTIASAIEAKRTSAEKCAAASSRSSCQYDGSVGSYLVNAALSW